MAKKELLEKVVVWENPDGTIAVTYFVKDAIRKDRNGNPIETEEQFINRACEKLITANPHFGNQAKRIKQKQEVQSFMNSLTVEDSFRIKIKPNGDLFVDKNHKTDKEKVEEKKNLIRQKLKANNPNLTDEELILLVR